MNNNWKMTKLLVLLLVLVVALVGCGKKADQPKATESPAESSAAMPKEDASGDKNSKLVLVDREINASLDPTAKHTVTYLRRMGAIESLFSPDASGKIMPVLANEIKQLDETHWEVTIKPEAKFWSGKDVTAQAVIDCFNRSIEKNARSKSDLMGLTFEAKGDKTLAITTKEKNVLMDMLLSNQVIYNAEKDYTSPENTDFTGMYKITKYVPKQELDLVINENWWNPKKPVIKNIIYQEVGDEQTRVLALKSGDADIAARIPASSVKEFDADKNYKVVTSNPSGTLCVYLNLQNDLLKDEKVRQALNWATNRKELVDLASEGYGVGVSTFLGSNPQFPEAKDAVYNKADLEKAGALLDEAGWVKGSDGVREKDGQKMHFLLYTWGSEKVLGEVLQNQWQKLGVDVEVQYVDYSVIEEARSTGKWDGLIETWTNYGDPRSILADQFGKDGSVNYGKFESPELDALMDTLKAATNDKDRHDAALAVNNFVAEKGVVVALMPRPSLLAMKANLEGFKQHFIQYTSFITNELEFK